MTAPDAPRWSLFGKLPSAGDFLRRNLPADEAGRLDAWLTGELGRRAEADPDGWEAAAEAAPLWRFRLPAGALRGTEVAGALAPSRDRAGRTFPALVFAGEGADAEAAAGLLAQAVEASTSADALLAGLDALPPTPAPCEPLLEGLGEWTSAGARRLVAHPPRGADFDALLEPAPGPEAAQADVAGAEAAA